MLFRNKKVTRAIAVFFILNITQSIFLPFFATALTNGPHQPEYTSYEDGGSTDLVNLVSGDFTYNIPLLEVPSPEGSFTVPLFYHSGIGLEDESSWAGLGFNVNVGAISRNKNGFADDEYDAPQMIKTNDPGGKGWVKNYLIYQQSWDSQKGYGGAIDLIGLAGFDWDNSDGLKSGNIGGVEFNKSHVKADPDKVMQAAFTAATIVATSGAGAPVTAAQRSASLAMSIFQTATSIYSASQMKAFDGRYNSWKTHTDPGLFKTTYKYWLDNTRQENGFGALYLGSVGKSSMLCRDWSFTDVPQYPRFGGPGNYDPENFIPTYRPSWLCTTGDEAAVASDMYMYVKEDSDYAQEVNPTHISYDNYSVMGSGVSGGISPYRLDVGTVIFPKRMTEVDLRYNPVSFIDDALPITPGAIKPVSFKYVGDISNSYQHHRSENMGVQSYPQTSNSTLYFDLEDAKLKDPEQRVEQEREGLTNKHLVHGKYIDWYSNRDLNNSFYDSRVKLLMEYKPYGNSERKALRASAPQEGIGAFTVTREDGTTYHYALPIYNHSEQYYLGEKGSEGTKYSTSTNGKYATTWLLTAITGPDFIDLGDLGTVDEKDLGYWVKFDYGKFASKYQWRQPYAGFIEDGDKVSYTSGVKETYYLNKITTRTHTAVFIKDLKKDGRGAYFRYSDGRSAPVYEAYSDITLPASSLKLNEIALFSNEDFKQLETLGFSMGTNVEDNSILANTNCSLGNVFDIYDVNRVSGIREFINDKSLKRISLNYTYELCNKTINSFSDAQSPPYLNADYYSQRSGKLTLKSLSFHGINSQKILPDMIFEYGDSRNPDYHLKKYDGWGMYNSKGDNISVKHEASTDKDEFSAWHLTKIITPLGSEIRIGYEPDSYSSVSGHPVKKKVNLTGTFDRSTGRIYFDVAARGIDLRNYIQEDQAVKLYSTGKQQCDCWDTGGADHWDCEYDYNMPEDQTATGVNSNSFILSDRPGFVREYDDVHAGRDDCFWKSISGYIEVEIPSVFGGDVRVAKLETVDEAGQKYSTRYVYSKDGMISGVSSGVVSKEPDFIKQQDYDFDNLYDYPSTSVLYGKVSVLNGFNESDLSFATKTEYNFVTPSESMVNQTHQILKDQHLFDYGGYKYNLLQKYHDVKVKTSQIGNLVSIKAFDNHGIETKSVQLQYTDNIDKDQGVFTSGSVLSELVGNTFSDVYFKFGRTAKTFYPSILTSVIKVENNVVTTENNKKWDFYTGEVLENESKDAWNVSYVTEKIPAYHLSTFASMGPKLLNADNANMLTQAASVNFYKREEGEKKPLLLSTQLWRNTWQYDDYRYLEMRPKNIWRKSESYLAQTQTILQDGTMDGTVAFNWSDLQNQPASWMSHGQVTKYDRFSNPVEIKDINGNFVSAKNGYKETKVIASTTNAQYTEMAYSGAEDKELIGALYYFGGKIENAEKQNSTYSHTGKYGIKLLSGEKGFIYKARIGTELQSNRKYRASVWIHKTDLSAGNGKLFAEAGATTLSTIDIKNVSVKQAGDWYLMNLYFDLPSTYDNQILTIGCKNIGSGEVYFDDFRFHPADAFMVSYVHDQNSFLITHVLDNDNLYMRCEYDEGGRVTKVFKEILTTGNPERIAGQMQYNFARLSLSQWMDTGNRQCLTVSDGSNSGEQEKEQRDINTESATYNQLRWISAGYNNLDCPTCSSVDKKFINGICETGYRENVSSQQSGSSWVCIYRYVFSDGTYSPDQEEINDTPCAI
jgi:hypothetical protein